VLAPVAVRAAEAVAREPMPVAFHAAAVSGSAHVLGNHPLPYPLLGTLPPVAVAASPTVEVPHTSAAGVSTAASAPATAVVAR
jgi:hypothetical protein